MLQDVMLYVDWRPHATKPAIDCVHVFGTQPRGGREREREDLGPDITESQVLRQYNTLQLNHVGHVEWRRNDVAARLAALRPTSLWSIG